MQNSYSELDSASGKLISALEQGMPLVDITKLFFNYKQLVGDTAFTRPLCSGPIMGIRLNESQHCTEIPLPMLAVLTGHVKALDFFLKEGAPLNFILVTSKGYRFTFLDIAVIYGHYEIIVKLVEECNLPVNTLRLPPLKDQERILPYLMSKGFNPCTLTEGSSMVHVCASRNNDTALKIFDQFAIDNNLTFNYDTPDSKLNTPLTLAAGKESLNFFIAKGLNVNHVNSNAETPLHVAVSKERLENVKLLLQSNANPEGNLAAGNEYTPLVIASYNGNIEIARLLIKYGANPRSGYLDEDGSREDDTEIFKTPLHCAIECNKQIFLEYLLNELKLDPDIKNLILDPKWNIDWVTPLEYACQELNYEAVDLLLQYGANPNFVAQGAARNSLSAAVFHRGHNDERANDKKILTNQYKIIKLLLSYGADIKFFRAPNTFEKQPRHMELIHNCIKLYQAVERSNLAGIIDLVDQDKDLACVMFSNGDTLLHAIIKLLDHNPNENQLAFVKFLAEESNHLHSKDRSGKPPVDSAREKDLPEVVDLLTSDLEKQLELILTDDVISSIFNLLSGYKTLRPKTPIPDGIQIFISEMITNLKLLEPQNPLIKAPDQATCLRKLFLARFNTLRSFTEETPGLIYEKTADRINKLLNKSQIDLHHREKYNLQASMVFSEEESQTLFRGLSNLHHICNNELQARQKSNLKPKEMPLDAPATSSPAITSTSQTPAPAVSVVTATTIGFYSTKRKDTPVNEDARQFQKKGKPDGREDMVEGIETRPQST